MADDVNQQRQFRKALELQDRIEQDHTAARRAQYLHSRRLELEEAFYEVQLAERSFQAELWWHTRCAGWRHYSQVSAA